MKQPEDKRLKAQEHIPLQKQAKQRPSNEQLQLVVVTAPGYIAGEGRSINELFASGMSRLHLRKPGTDRASLMRLLSAIAPEYYPLIAIHQHHEIADDFGIRRLHYTEQERRDAGKSTIKKQRDHELILSSSIHQLSAMQELPDFDYVFFGPVFNSISKSNYPSVVPERFVLPAHHIPIYAIGGITPAHLPQVREMNFDGAAMLGGIWQHSLSPVAAFEQYKKTMTTSGLCI